MAFGNAGTQTLDLASPAGAGQFHQIQVYSANLAAAKTSLYNALLNANAAGAINPLDGITDSSLHVGAKIGLALIGDHITIRPVRESEVWAADEIWLSSSTREVIAVTRLDGKAVGAGVPGIMFKQMYALFQAAKPKP